ncbi:sugar nucleotide-binding protein [bacterium]|nr:sugar nucleotide-binding protein [bacterium]
MKLLVVGGAGFLGRYVRAEAARHGVPALGTTTRAEPGRGLVRFDLAEDRSIREAVPADYFRDGRPVWVVVCSCTTPMDRCRTEWDYAYRVNVTNTIRLIDDAAAAGARAVFVSTSYVFDGDAGYYPEDWPHAPTSAYGQHKSEVDRYVTATHPDSLVVRLDKIVGADPAEAHPFSDWWNLYRAGKPAVCIADQVLSPTLVDDLAGGIVTACRLGLRGVYHLTGPEAFRRDHLARHFYRVMGVPGEVLTRPVAAFGLADPRPLNTYLDSSRFAAETGFRFTPMSAVMTRFRAAVGRAAA